jgi:hypothetical protein
LFFLSVGREIVEMDVGRTLVDLYEGMCQLMERMLEELELGAHSYNLRAMIN